MSNLLTNVAARTALQTLTQTNQQLDIVQGRISTGMRLASATDNAAYWSIATTMRSDSAALSTVRDALGLGSATVEVMYVAMDSSIELVGDLKKKLVAAREPGIDKTQVQSEITELQRELNGIATAAVFSGENWLAVNSSVTGYAQTKQVVASFSRSGGGVAIGTVSLNINDLRLYDSSTSADGTLDGSRNSSGALSTIGTLASLSSLSIAGLTDSAADVVTLESYIAGADSAISEMTNSATVLGAVQARLTLQQDFVSSLMDEIDQGIGHLVDADMTEEATKLQALQVQSRLGSQPLSIANQNSQNILSLFQ